MKFHKEKQKMGNNKLNNKGSTSGAKVFQESNFNGEEVNVYCVISFFDNF